MISRRGLGCRVGYRQLPDSRVYCQQWTVDGGDCFSQSMTRIRWLAMKDGLGLRVGIYTMRSARWGLGTGR